MELKEFLEKIDKLDVKLYQKNIWSSFEHQPPEKKSTVDNYLYKSWIVGGKRGNGCWDNGDSSSYSLSAEPEPDFIDLDVVLEELCPDISCIKYKKLIRNVVACDNCSIDEFYGNSTDYNLKLVKLGDLYNKLIEYKLI